MNHLVPCPDCQRHVRASEPECPFCGQALDLAATPEPVLPNRRLGRAALFAFGATLAASLSTVGCGGDSDDGGGGTGGASAGGGGSSGSGGTATGGSAGQAGSGSGGFAGAAPAYGLPATGGSGGGGGGQPLYGSPPPP